ncbi:hypothetical protein LJC49_00405 [Ruminococcaceae bacterium OttesenSCG-928-I18]|nr:hypothetical protein [Ruminococcaceae bacterium OttesenSCG-928-I18]
MTKNYFEEMMAELDFHVADNIALGYQQGFPLSVEFNKNAETTEFFLRVVVDRDAKPARKRLKEQEQGSVKWFSEKDEEGEGGVLVGVLAPPSDFYAKGAVHGAAVAAAETLKELDYAPPSRCPLCDGEGCDRYAYLAEGCRATHKLCLQTRLDLPEKDTKTPLKARGFYLTGILGALLGASIAALPNWSQALSKGTINSVIYAFIPFLSALLYRLFRGKANRIAGGVIVMVSSLIVAFLLELVWYWLVTTNMAGYNMSIATTTALYFESHSLAQTVKEMMFSLLFLILGFFPAFILLRRYAASGTTGGRLERGALFVRQSAFSVKKGKVSAEIQREAESEAGEDSPAREDPAGAGAEVEVE